MADTNKNRALSLNTNSNLGFRIRQIRKDLGWTQGDVGKRTGLAISTISKVENNLLSPTFEVLLRLAEGLSIEISELLGSSNPSIVKTRRSVTKQGQGEIHETSSYIYNLLCSELTNKKMYPLIARLKTHTMTEFGSLYRHPGEELFYVLKGKVELHTEHYQTSYLSEGDCAYFDSTMGHACISASEEDTVIFWVSTVPNHMK